MADGSFNAPLAAYCVQFSWRRAFDFLWRTHWLTDRFAGWMIDWLNGSLKRDPCWGYPEYRVRLRGSNSEVTLNGLAPFEYFSLCFKSSSNKDLVLMTLPMSRMFLRKIPALTLASRYLSVNKCIEIQLVCSWKFWICAVAWGGEGQEAVNWVFYVKTKLFYAFNIF